MQLRLITGSVQFGAKDVFRLYKKFKKPKKAKSPGKKGGNKKSGSQSTASLVDDLAAADGAGAGEDTPAPAIEVIGEDDESVKSTDPEEVRAEKHLKAKGLAMLVELADIHERVKKYGHVFTFILQLYVGSYGMLIYTPSVSSCGDGLKRPGCTSAYVPLFCVSFNASLTEVDLGDRGIVHCHTNSTSKIFSKISVHDRRIHVLACRSHRKGYPGSRSCSVRTHKVSPYSTFVSVIQMKLCLTDFHRLSPTSPRMQNTPWTSSRSAWPVVFPSSHQRVTHLVEDRATPSLCVH